MMRKTLFQQEHSLVRRNQSSIVEVEYSMVQLKLRKKITLRKLVMQQELIKTNKQDKSLL